jgi:hypothetical protein
VLSQEEVARLIDLASNLMRHGALCDRRSPARAVPAEAGPIRAVDTISWPFGQLMGYFSLCQFHGKLDD